MLRRRLFCVVRILRSPQTPQRVCARVKNNQHQEPAGWYRPDHVADLRLAVCHNADCQVSLDDLLVFKINKASFTYQRLQHGSTILEYQVVTGLVELGHRPDKVVAVSIVSRKIPRTITLKKRGVTKLEFLLTINYSQPISRDEYANRKDEVEKEAVEAMRKTLLEAEHPDSGGVLGDNAKLYNFKRQHTQVWQSLWSTGFEISSSLAEDSINGKLLTST